MGGVSGVQPKVALWMQTALSTRLHAARQAIQVRHPMAADSLTLRFAANPAPENPLLDPNLSVEKFALLAQDSVRQVSPYQNTKMTAMSHLTEALDMFLQGQWTEASQPGKKAVILDSLKTLMGARGQGNIVMAQIDTIPGRVAENAEKIMKYMKAAEAIGADMIVFPEMSLMGYPIYDAIGRYKTLVEQNQVALEALAKQSGKTRVAVGFVEARHPEPGQAIIGREMYNAVAILGEGKIESVVRKSLLPTYGEFNDYRMFEPSPASGISPAETLNNPKWGFQAQEPLGRPADIHGRKWGVAICEDGWNDAKFFTKGTLYTRDPVAELVSGGAEVLINTSASPTRTMKEQLKHNMLSSVSRSYQRPMVYVNRTGAVDEVIFDGASRVYDGQGNLVARAKAFSEQFMVVNPAKGEGRIYALPEGEEATFDVPKFFDPHDTRDLDRTYQSIVHGIRSYFRNTGMKRAVLGLSGGLDSSVCAVLLADALGPENVLGVSMPSKITSQESRTDARILAENLGIRFVEVPIGPAVSVLESTFDQSLALASPMQKRWDALKETLLASRFGRIFKALGLTKPVRQNQISSFWGNPVEGDVAHQNSQAIMRATYLRKISNTWAKTLPIATSDKSELYVGYATVNGDMSGALAPIGDVTKMKLFALARFMNAQRAKQGKQCIPEAVLLKKPGAELSINPATGKPVVAEDDYGPYEFRDEIVWRLENKRQTYDEMMQEEFWYEKEMTKAGKPLSAEVKKEWMDKFFRRMGWSFFKWYLMPTTLNVDARSITKSSLQLPITSGGSRWHGFSLDDITQRLTKVD